MYSVKFTPTKKRSACPHRRPFHVHIRQNGRFLSTVFSKYGFIRAFLFFGCHVLPILRGLRKYVFEFTAASRLLRGSSSGFVREKQPGSLIGIPGRLYPIFKPF